MRELATNESTKTCLVCDAPLSSLQRHQRVVLCGPRCRAAYSRLLPGQVCRFCGRPLSREGLAAGLCVGKDCRLKLAEKQRLEKEKREQEAVEAAARALHERATGREFASIYPLTIIPSNPLQTGPLPDERRRALSDHITGVLNELAIVDGSEPPPPRISIPSPTSPPPSPALKAVLSGACAVCRGSCCRGGVEKAYLDTKTLHRYRGDHPEATPREILGAYLDKLGETTYISSCVYHQPGGCGLPREMRSDTCNNYFCPELKEFEREAPEIPRAFFVAGREGKVNAAGFVDEDGVRPIEVPVDLSNGF